MRYEHLRLDRLLPLDAVIWFHAEHHLLRGVDRLHAALHELQPLRELPDDQLARAVSQLLQQVRNAESVLVKRETDRDVNSDGVSHLDGSEV